MAQDGINNKGKRNTLLQRKGLSRKEYAKRIATLKKQGIVSKSIDARSHKPTRYMLDKIRKYQDVATGMANAVRADKIRDDVRERYIERGIAQERDRFLVVPKSAANQKADISRGHIQLTNRLKHGEEQILLLPFKPRDFNEMLELIRDNASGINAMKYGDEQFGFQLFGHNSKVGYPDAEFMVERMVEQYRHILHNDRSSRQAVQDLNFVLLRFKHRKGMPLSAPYRGEKISHIRPKRKEFISEWEKQHTNRYRAGAKRRRRARETEEQTEKRLERQREYQREYARKKAKEKKKAKPPKGK